MKKGKTDEQTLKPPFVKNQHEGQWHIKFIWLLMALSERLGEPAMSYGSQLYV
jgi:hypothetical protein